MNRTEREIYKSYPSGDYHLCLDRIEGRWLFNTPQDYRLGMASIALFELMPNHIHIILSGTGDQCVRSFSLIKRRLSEQLLKTNRPALPRDYGFKLIPIPDKDALRTQILYTVRNPYEKNYCVPGGHMWGSGYLYFNELAQYIAGERVSKMRSSEVKRITGSNEVWPPQWVIHPYLGPLPQNYIAVNEVENLFSSVKEYLTRLVKEYEAVVKIAKTLGEDVEFSEAEVRDIVNTELRTSYPGRLFKNISQEWASLQLNWPKRFTCPILPSLKPFTLRIMASNLALCNLS